jgi:hypothetical protein
MCSAMTVFAVRLRRCFNGDWGLVGLVGHGSEEARKRSSGAKYINISAPAPLKDKRLRRYEAMGYGL